MVEGYFEGRHLSLEAHDANRGDLATLKEFEYAKNTSTWNPDLDGAIVAISDIMRSGARGLALHEGPD